MIKYTICVLVGIGIALSIDFIFDVDHQPEIIALRSKYDSLNSDNESNKIKYSEDSTQHLLTLENISVNYKKILEEQKNIVITKQDIKEVTKDIKPDEDTIKALVKKVKILRKENEFLIKENKELSRFREVQKLHIKELQHDYDSLSYFTNVVMEKVEILDKENTKLKKKNKKFKLIGGILTGIAFLVGLIVGN